MIIYLNREKKAMKTLLLSIICATLLTSCDKDPEPFNSCQKLSSGLLADNSGNVAQAVNKLISELPSAEYSEANLGNLAEKMSTACGISTIMVCFSCIHISPPQTELKATYMDDGIAREKIIVISLDAANRMVFHSMHD
jgi:hypothetical protein